MLVMNATLPKNLVAALTKNMSFSTKTHEKLIKRLG